MTVLERLRLGRKRIEEDTTYKVRGSQGLSLMEAAIDDVQERSSGSFSKDEKDAMRLLARFASKFDEEHSQERDIDLRERRLSIYDSLISYLEREGNSGVVGK